MGCLYIVCLYTLPVLLLTSLFVDGWAKFWTMSGLSVVSIIVLLIKVQWVKNWNAAGKEAVKRGVISPKSSILGASPIHAVFTIFAIVGYIYSCIWMILDSGDTFRLVINILF